MENQKALQLIRTTMGAFAPVYQRELRAILDELNLTNHWFILSYVRGVEPEPFTLNDYQILQPYTNQDRLAENLQEMKRQKWLRADDRVTFRLSRKGRKAIHKVYQTAQDAISTVEPLPENELALLHNSLQSLVRSSLDAKQPLIKLALKISRWTDPEDCQASMVSIEQYLTDLLRFRDDAHREAWSQYNLSPHAKETFTHVWREQACSPDQLVEALPHRGFSDLEYQQALCDLAGRGWVEQTLTGFKVTEKGARVRQKIEQITNQYYFSPWKVLKQDDLEAFVSILEKLHQHLILITTTQVSIS